MLGDTDGVGGSRLRDNQLAPLFAARAAGLAASDAGYVLGPQCHVLRNSLSRTPHGPHSSA